MINCIQISSAAAGLIFRCELQKPPRIIILDQPNGTVRPDSHIADTVFHFKALGFVRLAVLVDHDTHQRHDRKPSDQSRTTPFGEHVSLVKASPAGAITGVQYTNGGSNSGRVLWRGIGLPL